MEDERFFFQMTENFKSVLLPTIRSKWIDNDFLVSLALKENWWILTSNYFHLPFFIRWSIVRNWTRLNLKNILRNNWKVSIVISGMSSSDYLHSLYSNYFIHPCCWCHSVSAICTPGLHQLYIDQFKILGIPNWSIHFIYGNKLISFHCTGQGLSHLVLI